MDLLGIDSPKPDTADKLRIERSGARVMSPTAYYRDPRGIQEEQDRGPILGVDGTLGSPADSLPGEVTGTGGGFRPVLADQGRGAHWAQFFSHFFSDGENWRGVATLAYWPG